MKKVMFLLLLVLISIGVSSQKYPPIRPYNENGYSVENFRKFVYEDTKLSISYTNELLRIVNKNLYSTGEYININNGYELTESNLDFVFDHISISSVSIDGGFMNSRNKNGEVDWYLDEAKFYGPCFMFNFGKCNLILAKTICMNLLDVPCEYKPTSERTRSFTSPVITRPVISEWSPIQEERVVLFPNQAVKKKSWFVEGLCVFLGASLIATVGYLLSQKAKGPGGSPLSPRTPEPYVPPVPPPVVPPTPGGPGGTPLTP
jgi:hypothetical protein